MLFELQQQQQLRQLGRFRSNQAILGQRRLRLRQRELEIERASDQLPGSIEKNRQQLERTRDYMRKVREAAAGVERQRDGIDSQVMGQKAKIREAALDLAQQATKARDNIGKYRVVAHEQKKFALYTYQIAVERWWENAFEGLQKSIDARERTVANYIQNASRVMQEALMGRIKSASKAWQNQYNFKWKDWLGVREQRQSDLMPVQEPPRTQSIESADERIGKIEEASRNQEAKIGEQEGKILDAYASLDKRQRDAYRQLNKERVKRRKQFASLEKDQERILKNADYLKERGEKIRRAAEQTRQRKAQNASQSAQMRRGIAQTRRALAQLSRNKALIDANKAKANSFIAATNAGTKMAMPRFHPAFIQWMKRNDRPLLGRLRNAIKKQKTLK